MGSSSWLEVIVHGEFILTRGHCSWGVHPGEVIVHQEAILSGGHSSQAVLASVSMSRWSRVLAMAVSPARVSVVMVTISPIILFNGTALCLVLGALGTGETRAVTNPEQMGIHVVIIAMASL